MAKRSVKKRLAKLRAFRDKLLVRCTNQEAALREHEMRFHSIRDEISNEDYLRAYTLATALPDGYGGQPTEIDYMLDYKKINDVIAELTLTYRTINVERGYVRDVREAAEARDYLRIAALSAQHDEEVKEHDKMLAAWSVEHGVTRLLRKENDNEMD